MIMQQNYSDFYTEFNKFPWEQVKSFFNEVSSADVEASLKKSRRNIWDFARLISPAASDYLEDMARASQGLTQKRFGKTIQMYTPIYLSNKCQNICLYCGFSQNNKVDRKVLTPQEICQEMKHVKNMGYEHILFVTGESNDVGLEYFMEAMELAKKEFSQISFEVQPMDEEEYKALIDNGLHSVLLYQETYNENRYKEVHPKGKKSFFKNRLLSPEKIGRAGAYKIGLGCLLGLDDWRTDSFFTALHAQYLNRKFWKSKFSISFPRLRPFQGQFQPNSIMTDREFVQLICAYRLLDPNLELSLSTREAPKFRDNLIGLGITTVSAGSKTNPGGYSEPDSSLEQFEIHDNRSPAQMAEAIRNRGYEPVWKDWDPALAQNSQ